jgi:hypothetical protein
MYLQSNRDNTLEVDNKSSTIENKITKININKHKLKPIKINKPYNSLKYLNNQTIDINNKNPFILKEDKQLVNNNKLSNYLNSINKKKEHIYKIKDLSPNSRNSDNFISNDLSISSSKMPNNINITSVYSPKYKEERLNKFDYIKLNSLFNLPPLTKKMKPNNSPKTINTSNNNHFKTEINPYNPRLKSVNNKKSNNFINKSMQIKKKEEFENDKNNKYDNNINSFMKFKYYEDVNEKFEKKLKDDTFIDRGVKDKIIKIGKVGIFWRNVFEYCGSFIFAEKFKNIEKQFRKKYMKKEGDEYNLNKYSKTPNKILYTNILVNRLIHYKNRRINNNINNNK